MIYVLIMLNNKYTITIQIIIGSYLSCAGGLLATAGYKSVPNIHNSDIYISNTNQRPHS